MKPVFGGFKTRLKFIKFGPCFYFFNIVYIDYRRGWNLSFSTWNSNQCFQIWAQRTIKPIQQRGSNSLNSASDPPSPSSMYIIYLYVCLPVCLYPINVKTAELQILCGTSRGPREGLWMLRITKNCLQQFLIFVKFCNNN